MQYIRYKNAESGYDLVKWTSESYTLHPHHKLVKDVIKDVELMCDTVYLIQIAHFKQYYTTYEKNQEKNSG